MNEQHHTRHATAKVLAGLLLIASLSVPAFAQHHLLGGGMGIGMGMGGFAAPAVKFTSIGGEPALFVGGRAGMSLAVDSTSSFTIGGAAYSLVSRIDSPWSEPYGPVNLELAYGGVELEYALRPSHLVHFSASTLIGLGQSGCHDDYYAYDTPGDGRWRRGGTSFFVAEPGVGVTLNMARALRLDLGASYRFAGAVRSPELSTVSLSGPAGMVALRVGRHH